MRIIAGEFKGRVLAAPKGLQTRPTSSKVRASFFNSIQPYIEGATFLDIFAGSGAVGLEALSRGAEQAVFVEKSLEAQRCIRANIEKLAVGQRTTLWSGDVFSALTQFKQKGKRFSLIYIDPPYSTPEHVKRGDPLMSIRILQEIDQLGLLEQEGILCIEESGCVPLEEMFFETLHHVKKRDFGRTTLFQFRASRKKDNKDPNDDKDTKN